MQPSNLYVGNKYFRNVNFNLSLCLNSNNGSNYRDIYDAMKSFPSGHAQLSWFTTFVAIVGNQQSPILPWPVASRSISTKELVLLTAVSGNTGYSLYSFSLRLSSLPAGYMIIAIMFKMLLPGLFLEPFLVF